MRYHVYVVLIQDVKDLIEQNNVTICHTLREGNKCANFMVKLGVASNNKLLRHASPPKDVLHLLRMDALGIYFSRK